MIFCGLLQVSRGHSLGFVFSDDSDNAVLVIVRIDAISLAPICIPRRVALSLYIRAWILYRLRRDESSARTEIFHPRPRIVRRLERWRFSKHRRCWSNDSWWRRLPKCYNHGCRARTKVLNRVPEHYECHRDED